MKGNSSSLISSATAKEKPLLTHPHLAAKFLLLELLNPTTLCLLQQEIPPSFCQHQSWGGSACPCSATKGTGTFCGGGSVTSIIPVLHSTFSLSLSTHLRVLSTFRSSKTNWGCGGWKERIQWEQSQASPWSFPPSPSRHILCGWKL